jgi:hypothetical protein
VRLATVLFTSHHAPRARQPRDVEDTVDVNGQIEAYLTSGQSPGLRDALRRLLAALRDARPVRVEDVEAMRKATA